MNLATMLQRRRNTKKLLRVARMLRDVEESASARPLPRRERRVAVGRS